MLNINIFCSTQQAFNLHEFNEKIWSKGSTKEQHAPWKKLDLSIYAPQNYYFKRIPGTFKASSNAMFSGLQQRMKAVGECILLISLCVFSLLFTL